MLQSLLLGTVVMDGEVTEGVTDGQASQTSLVLAVPLERGTEVGVEAEDSVVAVVLQPIIQTCDLPNEQVMVGVAAVVVGVVMAVTVTIADLLVLQVRVEQQVELEAQVVLVQVAQVDQGAAVEREVQWLVDVTAVILQPIHPVALGHLVPQVQRV
jgi:hypothetical protein